MIWAVLGMVLGYLLVGTGLGRIAFIRILGDYARYSKPGTSTYTYDRARWATFVLLLFWPVAIWFMLMLQSTPVERLDRRRKELNSFQDELKIICTKYKVDV